MEILETLVRFQDPESADLLRKFLKLKNAEDQLRVIEIAGMYRVADLAQDLASMVRTFSFFRVDYVRNERIIEALGRIGHASAIPVLERLAKTKFSLYPKQLADLKLLLFQSLRLYEAAPLGLSPPNGLAVQRHTHSNRLPGESPDRAGAGRSNLHPQQGRFEDVDGSARKSIRTAKSMTWSRT